MITSENLQAVIGQLNNSDKSSIMEADYGEYICISLSVYNAGSDTRVEWISFDSDRENPEDENEYIFESEFLQEIIKNN